MMFGVEAACAEARRAAKRSESVIVRWCMRFRGLSGGREARCVGRSGFPEVGFLEDSNSDSGGMMRSCALFFADRLGLRRGGPRPTFERYLDTEPSFDAMLEPCHLVTRECSNPPFEDSGRGRSTSKAALRGDVVWGATVMRA